MSIGIIAAMSLNHVIGVDGDLPWHLPNDLKHFKQTTQGKTILMGRKTFESIGLKPLPRRRNIVISQDNTLAEHGVEVFATIPDALASVSADEALMVCGGSGIYEACLPLADTLYLTLVDAELEGHAFFPEWSKEAWRLCSEEHHSPDEQHPYAYCFQMWKKLGEPTS